MQSRSERNSLERIHDGYGAWREADDEEAALEELIRIMVRREPEQTAASSRMRRDEFVCRSCHMVQHQSRLADVRRIVCAECVRAQARRR